MTHHTLKTEHFNIHYSRELEDIAFRTAAVAEEVHGFLCDQLGWEVEGPTEVSIVDSEDSANGLASPAPYPYILLYAGMPDMNSSLQFHDYWLYSLFIHEYTHIIHLQMQHGAARVVNRIFGDVYLPNALQPRWFVEGLAVMIETRRTSRGRIRSSYYQMVMRTHALEGAFQSLDRASNSTLSYPRGDADYIYGAMFMDYLRTRFGERTIFEITHRYASKPVPYFLNTVFKEATGLRLSVLYRDFAAAMKARAEETRRQIEAGGVTRSQALTHTGENKGQPVFSGDGKRIYMPVSDGRQRAGVFELTADGRMERRMVLAGSRSTISVTGDGTLYYVRTAPWRNVYRFRDVFSLSPGNAVPERLSTGLRVKEASVSGSGDRMALTVARGDQIDLLLADGRAENRRVLQEGTRGRSFFNPSLSRDGRRLAVLIREVDRVDLFVVNPDTGDRHRITDDDAFETDPVFSPDGDYVLYGSDATGVPQIYAHHLPSGRTLQATNVVTGAASPALSPDGRALLFLQYSAAGWDLHRTAFAPREISSPPPREPRPPAVTPPPPVPAVAVPYNPLPTLRPRSWTLGYAGSAGGHVLTASTAIADARLLHSVSAAFSYHLTDATPSFGLQYLYAGLLPSFSMGVSRTTETLHSGYLVNGVPAPWTRSAVTADAGLSMTLMGLDDNHSISMGYTIDQAEPVDALRVEADPAGPLPDVPTQYFRCGLRAAWSWSNTWAGAFAISPVEQGRSLSAGVTGYHPALGGNQELMLLQWSWKEYILLPWLANHVLALNLSGGIYLGNPRGNAFFRAGGYFPQSLLSALLNSEGQGLPRIRGYATDSLSGDHYHSLRLEYRFPLWRPEWTVATFPLFFRGVHAGIFSDNILMSFDPLRIEDWRASAGAELVWTFFLGYYMPVTLRTGYARGIMATGVNEFIFVVGGTY